MVKASPILVAEVSASKDQLFTNDNKSRTDTETVTVAMFSKEFQEWGESCVSRNIGLPALTASV